MLIDVGELFSRSLALYKKHLKTVLGFVGLFALLGLIPIITGGVIVRLLPQATEASTLPWWFVVFFIVQTITLILLGAWLSAGFMASIARAYETGTTESALSVLRQSVSRTIPALFTPFVAGIYAGWPLFVASLLLLTGITLRQGGSFASILSLVGGLALIPATAYAVYMSTMLTFSMYSTVIDRTSIRGALSTSKSLVRGRWWSIFGKLIGVGFLISLLATIPASAISAIAGAVNSGTLYALLNFGTILIQLAVAPLVIIAHCILFSEAKKYPPTPRPTPPVPPAASTPTLSV